MKKNKKKNNCKKQKKSFIKEKTVLVRGVIRGKGKGYAFLEVDGKTDDYFVPSNNLNGALNGDIVIAELINDHGEVIANVTDILSKNIQYIVGTLVTNRYGEYVVLPDDGKLCERFVVTKTRVDLPPVGHKVVCKPVLRDREELYGEVIEVLGDPNVKALDLISIAKAHGLSEVFSDEVTAVARNMDFEVDEKDFEGREDFRNTIVVTIDGKDTKDYDDAICVEKTDVGYRLYVHIADVSHYVKEGSVLDKEAFRRGTSVYLPGMVYPMLPKELSNGICSLNPKVNRLTLSCIMDIDKKGGVIKSRIVKGIIKTARRMTYDEVQLIIDGDEKTSEECGDVLSMLSNAFELADILNKKRNLRGAIEFNDPEAYIKLDENGKCVDVMVKERTKSHELIEDFMLLANETIAATFDKLKTPFVYRIHEEPPQDKAEQFKSTLEIFGIEFSGSSPKDYSKLLSSVRGKDIEKAVNMMGLRAMAKAKYNAKDKGHFGLALKHYCHFTSPIRRYPDLQIHRIISAYLEGGKEKTEKYALIVSAAAEQSSMRENVAVTCEREALDCKKAEYMKDKIGKEFEGSVSSIIDSGFFVELKNTIEGFVRVNEGETNPEKLRISCKGQNFTLGSKVLVRCKNVFMNKIDFELI